jgi:hypothetical protein
LNAIFQDDGGNSANLNYNLKSGQAGSAGTTNILIDTVPGSQIAGHNVIGIVDEDNSADTLVGNGMTQFMIGNNAGDVFTVNSDASVGGGTGNDTVNVASGDYATTYLGAGNNVVNLADGAGVYLMASDTTGSDTVNATGGTDEYVSVGGSGYDATINISGATSDGVNTFGDTVDGVGGQTINLIGGGNTVEITAQSDNLPDTVNVTGGSSTIELDPNAVIVATGSFTAVNSNDTISNLTGLSVTTAGSATVTGGAIGGTIFHGTGAGDTVVAGSGATTLYGGSGTEFFSAGNDSASVVFKTGNGSDTLVGGNGNDTMSVVGTGAGLFEFSSTAPGGTHVIDAFSESKDTIDLSGYTNGNVASDTSTGSGSSEVTTISLTDGTKITVHGIFHSSDIKFS